MRIYLSISELVHIVELMRAGTEQSAPDNAPEPELLRYMCVRTGHVFLPSPGSKHGPCEYIACCLDHCRCEHSND